MMNKYFKSLAASMAVMMIFLNGGVVMAAPEVIQVGDEFTVFDPDYYKEHFLDGDNADGYDHFFDSTRDSYIELTVDKNLSVMDREALIQYYITSGDCYDYYVQAYDPLTDVTALLEPFRQIDENAVNWAEIKLIQRHVGHGGTTDISTTAVSHGNGDKRNVITDPLSQRQIELLNARAAALMEARTIVKASCSENEIQPGVKELMVNPSPDTPTAKYSLNTMQYVPYYIIQTKIDTDDGIADYPLKVSFNAEDVHRSTYQDYLRFLEANSVPGYEWRGFAAGISLDDDPDDIGDLASSCAASYFLPSADNSKDWQQIDSGQQIGDPRFRLDYVDDAYRFTITQDGIDYPECKAFIILSEQSSHLGYWKSLEYYIHPHAYVYMLVPVGYTGNAYCHIYGATEENGMIVPNFSQRITCALPKIPDISEINR